MEAQKLVEAMPVGEDATGAALGKSMLEGFLAKLTLQFTDSQLIVYGFHRGETPLGYRIVEIRGRDLLIETTRPTYRGPEVEQVELSFRGDRLIKHQDPERDGGLDRIPLHKLTGDELVARLSVLTPPTDGTLASSAAEDRLRALYNATPEQARARLGEQPELATLVGDRGRTALHKAAKVGRLTYARMLLDSGADVNAADESLWTPLHLAAMFGEASQPAMIRLLLEHGAEISARDTQGATPLIVAAQWASTRTEALRVLIEAGADVNARAQNGDSALLEASSDCNPDLIRLLLDSGAEVNVANSYHDHPLNVALRCKRGNPVEVVRLLLDAGADPNAPGQFGNTPLSGARANVPEAVQALVDKGARLSSDEMGRLVRRLVERGDRQTLEAMIARGEISASEPIDGIGIALLPLAAEAGQLELVDFLLDRGIDPEDYTDRTRQITVRDTACAYGHFDVARRLLKTEGGQIGEPPCPNEH